MDKFMGLSFKLCSNNASKRKKFSQNDEKNFNWKSKDYVNLNMEFSK
tara:strand:+ start:797 stop:937 length:141 start_codon:yes stop_codon:yes gene_type:complete